jgi:hypothetical protein
MDLHETNTFGSYEFDHRSFVASISTVPASLNVFFSARTNRHLGAESLPQSCGPPVQGCSGYFEWFLGRLCEAAFPTSQAGAPNSSFRGRLPEVVTQTDSVRTGCALNLGLRKCSHAMGCKVFLNSEKWFK